MSNAPSSWPVGFNLLLLLCSFAVLVPTELLGIPKVVIDPVRFVAPVPERTNRVLCAPSYDCGGLTQTIEVPLKKSSEQVSFIVGAKIYPMLHPRKLAEKLAMALGQDGQIRTEIAANIFSLTQVQSDYTVQASITDFALAAESNETNIENALFGLLNINSQHEQGVLRVDFSLIDNKLGRYIDAFSLEGSFGNDKRGGVFVFYSSESERKAAISSVVSQLLDQGAARMRRSL